MEDQPVAIVTHEAEQEAGSPEACADDGVFIFPLSPQQLRFWHADRALPGNRAYNGAFRHELTGPVSVKHFEAAFNELIRRHEVLRATCREVDGEPALVIRPERALTIVFRDLRNLTPERKDDEMQRLCAADAQHSFDLSQGPLIRVGLIRMEDERYVLTLTLHHIICDGWSIGLLMDELPQIYAALVEGKPINLPDLEIQFGDYLVWLQDNIKQPHIVQQIAYWREKLAGYQRLEVEPDLGRPNGPTLEGEIISSVLPDELIARLRKLSIEQGGTLYTISLAALMSLLRHETGREDICVGSPIAGRTRPEIEKLVGPLLNYVLFRVRVENNMTFRDLEAAVRETLLEAFSNQDAPLDLVIEALRSSGQDVPNPFYYISFVSQRAFAGGQNFTSESGGVRIRTMPSKSQGALYDLFFFLIERENGWRLSLEYRAELYSPRKAQHLLDEFCAVLRQMADDPDAPLSRFHFPSAPPVNGIPNDDGLTLAPAPQTAPAEGAKETRSAEAGSDQDVADESADYALAASYAQERFWLLAKVAPNSPAFNMPTCIRIEGPLNVAALSKSFDWLAKRHEALRTTLEEQDGRLLQIISPDLEGVLAEGCIEAITSNYRDYLKARALEKIAIPFDLTRGPLIRAHLFRYSEVDSLLVITIHHAICDGHSLGLVQRDLWLAYEALCAGREPAMAPLSLQYGDFAVWQREWATSPAAKSRMEYWKRTLAQPLPVAEFPLDRLPSGRPGSAAMESISLAPRLLQGLSEVGRTQNVTRFMVTAAAFAMLLARYSNQEDLLFGCPAANRNTETDALIGPFAGPLALRFDLRGNPTLRQIIERARNITLDALVEPDIPFELLFESLAVRSIRGRNPLFQFYFTYQTAFLQSRDVCGLRITPISDLSIGAPYEVQLSLIERPNEVAAKVEYNPSLLDASTVRNVLNYYENVLEQIISNPDQTLADLPAPSVRTVADRNHAAGPVDAPKYLAPRTAVEKQLTKIWERLFDRSPIGVREDFFELGGHSLLAARLVLEIQKELGVRIDLSTLTEARTIQQLAVKVESPSDLSVSRAIALQPKGHKPPLFCVHGVGGHVFHFVAFAAAAPEDQPVYALAPPQAEFASEIRDLGDLAAYYVREVQAVQQRGPYYLCGYSLGGPLAFEMARMLQEAGEEVGKLIILDSPNPQYYGAMRGTERLRFQLSRLAQRNWLGLIRRGPRGAMNALRKLLFGRTNSVVSQNGADVVAQSNEKQMTFLSSLRNSFTPTPFMVEAVLFRSDQDPEYNVNPSLGWEQIALKGAKVIRVGGDHLSMMRKPRVEQLMRLIIDEIK